MILAENEADCIHQVTLSRSCMRERGRSERRVASAMHRLFCLPFGPITAVKSLNGPIWFLPRYDLKFSTSSDSIRPWLRLVVIEIKALSEGTEDFVPRSRGGLSRRELARASLETDSKFALLSILNLIYHVSLEQHDCYRLTMDLAMFRSADTHSTDECAIPFVGIPPQSQVQRQQLARARLSPDLHKKPKWRGHLGMEALLLP